MALLSLATSGMILTGCPQPEPSANTPSSSGSVSVSAPPSTRARPVELTVFAAASLTEPFKEMGKGYQQATPGVKIINNFSGSQTLRTQLEQGAQADIFASANQKHMEGVRELTEPAQPFVRNIVTVILSQDSPHDIHSLADLAQPGKMIMLTVEGCPIGDYTREVLGKLDDSGQFGTDFKKHVLANVVSHETNVKHVVAKVALGEADAGFVYTSDVTEAVQELPIPEEFNLQAEYLIAVMKASPQPEAAQEYIDWILSEKGQTILQKHGFRSIHAAPPSFPGEGS